MALVNDHFLKLTDNYLFADITKRVNAYKATHPRERVISLGIGDVTQPLCPAVVEAMHRAVDEMSRSASFRGYGPERGYGFLREAIVKNDYLPRGVHLDADEIFISDGAKTDVGNFQELLRWDNSIAVTDPVYPVYIDSNAMIGRAGVCVDGRWQGVTYLPCTAENNFTPALPDHRVDMIYLCYPNNPTGTVLTKKELRKWVSFALRNDAIILYDAAYEAYIQDDQIPHTIYEIKGARKCAIEFRSYSKTAGFTGVRCGYTVVPKEVTAVTTDGQRRVSLNQLWNRRQSTKFNGASYVSQRAAEAVYTSEGRQQTRQIIAYYMQNAAILRQSLQEMGFRVYGGEHAPYLWVAEPKEKTTYRTASPWRFFDELLYGCGVVITPGIGFGPSGDGYFRLTAFSCREDIEEALTRMRDKY